MNQRLAYRVPLAGNGHVTDQQMPICIANGERVMSRWICGDSTQNLGGKRRPAMPFARGPHYRGNFTGFDG